MQWSMVSAPVGYQRPSFPSLYWPVGPKAKEFDEADLYHFKDIWLFTTAWSIIFMTGLYTAAAGLLLITHYAGSYKHPTFMRSSEVLSEEGIRNRNIEMKSFNYNLIDRTTSGAGYGHRFVKSLFSGNTKLLVLAVATYIFSGAFLGFFSGSMVGLLIAAVYNSAQFRVTPWIPFVFSLIIMLFNIASSYSFTVSYLWSLLCILLESFFSDICIVYTKFKTKTYVSLTYSSQN